MSNKHREHTQPGTQHRFTAFHSALASGLGGSIADEVEIPSTCERKSRSQALCSASEKFLFAVSKGTFYYPGGRELGTCKLTPPSVLFQVPALEVGTNCIKATAELPPPGHTGTLLRSDSWPGPSIITWSARQARLMVV